MKFVITCLPYKSSGEFNFGPYQFKVTPVLCKVHIQRYGPSYKALVH